MEQLIEFNKKVKARKASKKYRKTEKYQLNQHKNKDKLSQQVRKWVETNRERKRKIDRAYYEKNKDKPLFKARRTHNEAKRRAKKLNATPKWLTKEQLDTIKNFYEECPSGYHVDHIVPLQGISVSGLHVPWNLQLLTSTVNRSKSNKVNN